VVGAATYQNINGFLGPSVGTEVSAGAGLVDGFGYNVNSSGVSTYATVSGALGENLNMNFGYRSVGATIIPVCKN